MNDFLIYASGVSNSKTTNPAEYNRERSMLQKAISENPDKTIVYFSTCSVYDPIQMHNPYAVHKKSMEDLICTEAQRFIIFRVSNVVGQSSNPNTVFNFFINHIKSGQPFILWKNTTRNLIDIDDLYATCNHILINGYFKNGIVNIANPDNYPVTDIVAAVEKHYNLRGNYTLEDKGAAFLIDVNAIKPLLERIPVYFDALYMDKLLYKYAS